jgi:hypothetical protein
MSVVRLAASTPICTHEELAAMSFEPWPGFVGFGKDPQAMEHHEEFLRAISIASRFAVSLLGKTKTELIESVRHFDEDRDEEANSMTFLTYLTDAREKAEALLRFITTAECRHACAMACAYPDDDAKQPPIPKPPAEPLLGRRKRK